MNKGLDSTHNPKIFYVGEALAAISRLKPLLQNIINYCKNNILILEFHPQPCGKNMAFNIF